MVTPHTCQFIFALNSDTPSVFDDEVLYMDDIARSRTRCLQRIENMLVSEFDLGVEAFHYFVGLAIKADLPGKRYEFRCR